MTDKITRAEAERAKAVAIKLLENLAEIEMEQRAAGNPPNPQVTDALVSLAILRQCRIIEPGGLDAETLLEAAKMVAAHRDKYPLSVFPNNLMKHAKVLRENGLAIDRISAENHRQASVALEDELIARADAIEKGE